MAEPDKAQKQSSSLPEINVTDTSLQSPSSKKIRGPSLSIKAAQSNGTVAYDTVTSPDRSRNASGALSPISENESFNFSTPQTPSTSLGSKLDPLSRQIIARTHSDQSVSKAGEGSPTTPNLALKSDGDASDSGVAQQATTQDRRNGSGSGSHPTKPRKDSAGDAALQSEDMTEEEALAANPNMGKKKRFFSGKLFGMGAKSKEDKYDKPTAAEEANVEGNDAPLYEGVPGLGAGQQPPRYIRVRSRRKNGREFNKLFLAQQLAVDPVDPVADAKDTASIAPTVAAYKTNAIWCLKFSKDGKYLAAAGQDMVIRVWEVLTEENTKDDDVITISQEYNSRGESKLQAPVFQDTPLHVWQGHTSDVLDLSWSKSNFLLSSSMDKTVRLWHPSRSECLCAFQHLDFVTAIAFHPRDDRFFLSGSLDCKLRLWNIPEKKVSYWAELPELITAIAFSLDGKMAVAGTLVGLCMFYETEGLKYNTQIHVRSTRGKNAKGSKITGIEPMPGTAPGDDKLLITSNDSRVRCYNMRDKALDTKYKGLENYQSQIRATFSDDGRYLITGSEDRHVYIWNNVDSNVIKATHFGGTTGFFASSEISPRRPSVDSNASRPGPQPARSTAAARRQMGHHPPSSKGSQGGSNSSTGWVMSIKREKPGFESFEAHDATCTVAIFAPTRTKQLLAKTKDPIFLHTPSMQSYGIHPVISSTSVASNETGATTGPEVLKDTPLNSPSANASGNNDTDVASAVPQQLAREGSIMSYNSLISPTGLSPLTYPDGNIIVSADSAGCIKVFRHDCAFYYPASTQATLHYDPRASKSRTSLVSGDAASLRSKGSLKTHSRTQSAQNGAGGLKDMFFRQKNKSGQDVSKLNAPVSSSGRHSIDVGGLARSNVNNPPSDASSDENVERCVKCKGEDFRVVVKQGNMSVVCKNCGMKKQTS